MQLLGVRRPQPWRYASTVSELIQPVIKWMADLGLPQFPNKTLASGQRTSMTRHTAKQKGQSHRTVQPDLDVDFRQESEAEVNSCSDIQFCATVGENQQSN